MKIEKLYINAFAKFSEETFHFEDGFNIIYGKNETGKSSIHKFIEGVFFSFKKANTSRRYWTEDLDFYRPWNSKKYSGFILYKHNGSKYRLERDFAKERDKQILYDEITGEDLSNKYKQMPNQERNILEIQTGLNQNIYRNTISISQMKVKCHESLIEELKTKLANLNDTKSEDISVESARQLLKEAINKIGTERQKTKKHYKLLKRIDFLEEELKESIKIYKVLKEKEIKLNRLREKKEEIKKFLKEKKDHKKKLIMSRNYTKYKIAQKIKEKIEEKKEGIKQLSYLENFPFKKRDSLLGLKKDIDNYKERLEELNQEIKDFKKNEEVPGKSVFEIGAIIKQKYKHFEELDYKLLEELIEFSRIEEKISNLRFYMLLSFIFFLFALGGLFINIFMSLSILPSGLFLYIYIVKKKRFFIKKEKKVLKDYLQRFNVSSTNELRKKYLSYKGLLFKKELCEKQDILNKKKEEINKIFDKANVKSIKGYEKKYTLFIKYKKLKENSKNLEQKLNVVLEGKDYDDLVDTVKDYYSNSILPEYNELKYRKLEDNIFNIQNKLMKIKEDISRLDTEINEGMNNLDNPVSIEERLNMAKIKKEQNVIKLRALKIADNFIKDASRKIHREFAPQLNKTVAKTINKITSGKYNNIRISPDMKIKVIHRNGEIHELSELSKGTIDQFYFATRIALASLLTGTDDLPLLFDDSFVQFDRERLKNTIKYLYHLSADRQIILFTCHQRELDIINELGFEVNLIKL